MKIGDITITEWQSPFYTLHDFDNIVDKNLAKNAVNPAQCGREAVTEGESKWGKVR
ncbi:hypothetical protein J7S95_11895 [Providencia stuartii]|uniref:hypothetical protein n=1 Tax=Providencia TaxID=586 RepID=UPI001B4CA029|nr:hypothetical protein [Providencia stuartii]MBQ0457418.1 hypothetical protein [Providencia stuartii]